MSLFSPFLPPPSLPPPHVSSCFLSSCLCKTTCPFRGLSSPPFSLCFQPPPCFVSPSLSPVMSLSRRESLGYQCTATDRKCLINKLSCFFFPSPLYPPPFFLKRGLPLLPTTFLLIPTPLPSSSSPPSLLFLPVVDGRESQVCDNNYTYTWKKKKCRFLHLISLQ